MYKYLLLAAILLLSGQARAEDYTDLSSFPKWQYVMKKAPLPKRAKEELTMEDISQVNHTVNKTIRYYEDFSNHWQTPAETGLKGHGDCKDIAILKYYELYKLGGLIDNMRIVVGKYKDGVLHAVLEIKTEKGIYVLDNRHENDEADEPYLARDYFQKYMPEIAYSINHKNWSRRP